MNKYILLKVFILLLLTTSTLFAAPIIEETPLSRPNLMSFTLQSEVLNQTMIIEISLPLSYAYTDDSTNYPVNYVADGIYTFLSVSTDNTRGSFGDYAPEMITVGIEFQNYYDECNRSKWFTPTMISDDENCGEAGGGADEFLSFIRDELKPFINQTFRADQTQEIFSGHSHSATLALYALFTQHELFDMYIAASPSIYWDNEVMFQFEQQFVDSQVVLDKPVYISVGLNEAGGASDDQATVDSFNEQVFSYVYRMGRKFKQDFPAAPIRIQAFPKENHTSSVGPAFHNGIHYVLKGE